MFPKRTRNLFNGRKGEVYFQCFVVMELKCIYHPIRQEDDYGIDGWIELVKDSNVTGKFVSVQLKHGNSYFSKKTLEGYKYIGDEKHLNYYCNHNLPIYIIIMDEEFEKMHWVMFEFDKITKLANGKWWIEVPRNNKIKVNFKQHIMKVLGDIVYYQERIDSDNNIKLLDKPQIKEFNISYESLVDSVRFYKIYCLNYSQLQKIVYNYDLGGSGVDLIQETFLSYVTHYPLDWPDDKVTTILRRILRGKLIDWDRNNRQTS